MNKFAMLALTILLFSSCAGQNKSVIALPNEKNISIVSGFRWDGTGVNVEAAPVTE